ncbi:zinc finger, CCHC-type containing protein [Tanacetum coccineum]
MAGNTVKDMTTNFGKLDKFEGHDFRRWQKKMHFLLTTLKVVFVLTYNVAKLWEEQRGSNRIKGKVEWVGFTLISKYMAEDSLNNYTQHGLKMDESISVSSIIDKLPPFRKIFKPYFETWAQGHVTKGKGKESTGPSGEPWQREERNMMGEFGKKGLRTIPKTKVDEIASILYMGDDHFAPVHGKGSVVLEFSSGKSITLFNVLYVPKLRKNLISGFGYYNNGMFMLNLNKVPDDSDSVYMSSSTVVNSSLWHARLGHVHYKRMLEMSKDELIPAIDENPDKWPLLVPDPKRKTLGERGIDCIFVGYAKHSKDIGFLLLNLMTLPKDIIPNLDESQRDDHSDDVQVRFLNFVRLQHGSSKEDGKSMETIDKFKARLVIQGFRQKEGIDYFDTYAPVARITTIILLLALAATHNLVIHQMNVKTSFLNDDLDEEVYMKDCNYTIHYIEKILKKFNHEDCSPVSTLMDPVEKLKPNTSKPVDQLEYSRAIGCLMYAMTSTRPDIAYAVGRLSRFTSNPSRQHWQAITRVFKYLKGTMNYGLSYMGYPSVLEGYRNDSWIIMLKILSLIRGVMGVPAMGDGAISWVPKSIHASLVYYGISEFVHLAAVFKDA